jgi:hypothetical protein
MFFPDVDCESSSWFHPRIGCGLDILAHICSFVISPLRHTHSWKQMRTKTWLSSCVEICYAVAIKMQSFDPDGRQVQTKSMIVRPSANASF